VLEFMSGADPIPEMQGTMTASSALLLARMLLAHIPLGDIQGSPEIPNFDSSAPHDSGVSQRGLASSAPRPSRTTSRQGAAGLNGRCVALDDTGASGEKDEAQHPLERCDHGTEQLGSARKRSTETASRPPARRKRMPWVTTFDHYR
jgi:hypothetical protein